MYNAYNQAVQTRDASSLYQQTMIADVTNADAQYFSQSGLSLTTILLFAIVIVSLLTVFYVFCSIVRALFAAKADGWQKASAIFSGDAARIFGSIGRLSSALADVCRRLFAFIWSRPPLRFSIIGLIVVVVLLKEFPLLDVVYVRPGQRLVNMKTGVTSGMGIHLVSPLLNQYIVAHVANYDFDIPEITADSSEPQDVILYVNVVFHLNEDALQDFYLREGAVSIWETANSIVRPRVIEAMKGVVNQYSYKEVLLAQADIKQGTLQASNDILGPLGITISDLNIVNIMIPRSYVQKIEERELVSESTEIARRRLEEERIKTQTELEIAERTRDKHSIEAQGLRNASSVLTEMIELRRLDITERQLENDRLAIDKWNGTLPNEIGGNFSLTPGR